MLLLAHAVMPRDIAVMSVDHGLRPEASSEVALVKALCNALEIPFTSATVSVSKGNIQAKAREARYHALLEWAEGNSLSAVATAHHADDQAETLLMRLARGSGLAGLSGVRASTYMPGSQITLVRPLLWTRKSELEDAVRAVGLAPAIDPSNANIAFDRVRVRQHLASNDWLDAHALAASAGYIAEGWRALEWYAELDREEMVSLERDEAGAPTYLYCANVPRIIQIETVCHIVSELGGRVSRGEAGRAADRLWRGHNASLGGVLAVPSIEKVEKIGVEMRVWRFSPEPPRNTH